MQNTSKPPSRREYFYTVDARGNVIHDGAIVDDSAFLARLYSSLKENTTDQYPDYRFYAKCGPEWNYLATVDTPIVFQSLADGHLHYAPQHSVPFNPMQLRFGANGVLYHAAPVGSYGRISPTLAVELARNIHPWGPWFAYHEVDSLHPQIEVIEPLQIEGSLRLLRPRIGNSCVGCGRDSDHGLKLSFLYDDEQKSVRSWFTADNRLMGSLQIMHGGFVALLLDETMGKILGAMGIKAPTAQLNVRYRAPVPIGEELILSASIEKREGRKNHLQGEIRRVSQPDVVLAEANALFIRIAAHNVDEQINVNVAE